MANVLGFEQVSVTGTAAALTNIPAGTERAWLQAESANVRWRADGTDPTASVGMIIYSTDVRITEISTAAGLRAAKFIAATGSPKLNITYFGP